MDGVERYPHLFSPIRLGPLRLAHRAVMSGHGLNLADRRVGRELVAYMVERARGGAALVTLNSAPVHRSAHHFGERQLALYDDAVVPGLRRLADAVHRAGSPLGQILWHGGHNIPHRAGAAALAPSPLPAPWLGDVPRAITQREIRELVAAYGSAARRCRDAGLDAIEVQTGSDYLLGSFLSPILNRRKDEYGGSLENRVRIVREVLEAVRVGAGDGVAVGVRTCATHLVPTDPDGYGLAQSVPAMRLLADAGLVDWVSVIVGSHYAADHLIPHMGMPRGAVLDFAAAMRAALPVPVMAAGRIRTAAEAEAAIRDGRTDVVAMARTWIAEPRWGALVAAGEEARIRPCVSCNQGCWATVVRGATGTCVVNPEAARETVLRHPARARPRRRVAIVGGGPAGLEAARVLAERGHAVTLHEAREDLGGELRLAGSAPGRRELLEAVAWWERELGRLGVEVRLGSRVDAGGLDDAELLVWAVGATPGSTSVWRLRPHLVDGIPGTRGLPHGRDVLRGSATVAGRVLVVDEEGGWPAVSLAEQLAATPSVTAVEVATPARALGEPDLTLTLELPAVGARLREAGVVVHADTLVLELAGGEAVVAGGRLGPYDDVVLSTGTVAPELPAGALAVGDCVAPRGLWAATHDAARLARVI